MIGENIFDVVPVTFHVKNISDPSFADFESCFNAFGQLADDSGKRPANLWIVKPGENTNRGNGINVCNTIDQIKAELKLTNHTFIIQKYIENPCLVNKRKSDIRCYALITCFNGVIQGYFFNEGYLRTASKPFSLQATNKFVHLTNDAVQKFSEDYGKFENGNKMSYTDFQRYLDSHSDKNVNFIEEILPLIKNIVQDSIKSVFLKLDPNHRAHAFEIFGYDFLLDNGLKPWLLEVNTNPCLELSSPHLSRIIPAMIDNALRICIDPVFQEPQSYIKHLTSQTQDFPENKFELIFNSNTIDQEFIEKLNSAQFDAIKNWGEIYTSEIDS